MTLPLIAAARPAPVRVVASSTVAMTLAVAPAYLIGATAVQMRADILFEAGALGLVIGLFFGATSLTSSPGGRLAERVGPRRGLLLCLALGTVAHLGIATLTWSLPTLILWTVVGGCATGVALPAASLALVRGAPLRPGLMFGLSQSAPPASSLLAGVAVPAISLQVGWRWAFVASALLAVVSLALLPPASAFGELAERPDGAAPPRRLAPGFGLVGAGVAFGSAAAISLGAFLVSSAVSDGIAPGTAGLLLAVGSAVGITARLIVGFAADRLSSGHLHGVAVMLGMGAAGYTGLALGNSLPILVIATIFAYGFGYGWSGLLFFAVARLNPAAPGVAIGVVNTGATAGAALGPMAFGLVLAMSSFTVAWAVAAVASLAAAGAVTRSARRLDVPPRRMRGAQSIPKNAQWVGRLSGSNE